MDLKVDTDELLDVMNVMKKDAGDYDKEINNILGCIETLRTIWMGQDATIYCENVSSYVRKMKGITSAMTAMSEVGEKTCNGYLEYDTTYGKSIQGEVAKYE